MGIEFTNAGALILLLLIPAAIYLARHSLANLSRGRAWAAILARSLLVLLCVLALAGLRLRSSSRDVAVMFLVDVSSSVAQEEQRTAIDFINREIERAGSRDYLCVIAFGRDAAVELAPTRKELLGNWRLSEISSNPPRDYTNFAGALRLAAALVPEDASGRIVLISDGNENLESALREAPLLRAEAIAVYTRALRTVSEGAGQHQEVAVRELNAPEMAAEGESFDLKVAVDSTLDTTATLRVFRNDSLVAERQVELTAAGENVFVLPQRNEEKGFYTYRAEVEALGADSFKQNNAREAFTVVQGRPKTLYLYGDTQPSPAMLRVLAEGSFAATVRSYQSVPISLAGFQDYDLVVFDNVPAAALTKNQMKMVQSYVRDLGGGFMMIGGDQSFGPGGYYKTPIEETLPVSLDVRQKKHFPSLAIALVMDKSGSMSGQKMELAAEAASATVDFLSDRDSVGVIAFDGQATEVVELTKVENKRAIIDRINAIAADGGTNIYPGLQMAYERLSQSDAQIKHIILLSDGMSEGPNPASVAKAISDAGMTLTSVAIEPGADIQTMQSLAKIGGGRFYATDSPESFPRIFTSEAFLASRETIIEEPFVPKLVRPTQATNGIDWNTAPQLNGYVGTAERDSVQSPAITSLFTHKDDPLYAIWQYGLGRSAAFTADAKPRWAAGWMGWTGFGQFWTQALRETLRREGASDLTPRVEVNTGSGRVIVEAVTPEGRYKNNLRLRAHIVAPDLSASDIPLEQTEAGRYEGQFAATARGAYLVSISEEGGQSAPVAGAVNSYSPEFSIADADANLLAEVSEATGGQMMSETADNSLNLFEPQRTKTKPHEIWSLLLLLALWLLLIDVGIRRLHLTREQFEEARDWIWARVRRAKVLETEEATASLGQLKASRRRVRLSGAAATPTNTESKAARESEAQAGLMREEAGIAAVRMAASTLASEPSAEDKPAEATRPLASKLLEARRKRRE